jgi:WD40 repeat protein
MSSAKRAEDSAALVPSAPKRQRTDQQLALASDSRALAAVADGAVPRTSSLDAPTMLLTGHADAVCAVAFSPDGAHLVSGSVDKAVLLWNVRGDCQVRARAAPVPPQGRASGSRWRVHQPRLRLSAPRPRSLGCSHSSGSASA